jgi:hypothetical protein
MSFKANTHVDDDRNAFVWLGGEIFSTNLSADEHDIRRRGVNDLNWLPRVIGTMPSSTDMVGEVGVDEVPELPGDA